jgi:hypothetical protein
MATSKAERILSRIQSSVGGDLRVSRRGVPHLVVGGIGGLSVAYFEKRRFVRVFTGYMLFQQNQEKFDFDQWPNAKAFIVERLGRDSPAIATM